MFFEEFEKYFIECPQCGDSVNRLYEGRCEVCCRVRQWTVKLAQLEDAISIHDDGSEYYYIAGPDRKGQIVMKVATHNYYEIVQERFINKVIVSN